ncbi:hypothetical protein AB7M49_003235 [Bradyrhizobium elkanii]
MAARVLGGASAATQTGVTLSLQLPFLEQYNRIYPQGSRNLFEGIDGRSILFALNHSDVVAIQASTISQLLLG